MKTMVRMCGMQASGASASTVALVILAGAMDGALRAHLGQPALLEETHTASTSKQAHRGIVAQLWRWKQSSELFQDPFQYSSVFANSSAPSQHLLGQSCAKQWNCEETLVCINNACNPCTSDAECRLRRKQDQCYEDHLLGYSVCQHRALFPDFDASDLWMVCLTFLIMFFAAPVGIGGGPILVPMFLSIGHFSPQGAIPLSPATIFGGALANNLLNIQRRHPTQDKPVIDYDVCSVMAPALLLSTIFGVFFNAVAPRWVVTLLLVLLFLHISYLTSLKTSQLFRAENDMAPETQPLLPDNSDSVTKPLPNTPLPAEDPAAAAKLEAIVQEESKTNLRAVGSVTAAWLIVFVTSFIKGGRNHPGLVPCGSLAYWGVVLLPVPLILAMTWSIIKNLTARYEAKMALGHHFAPGDIQWTKETCRLFVGCGAVGGFAAGSLGIAAGLILGPVLLEIGVLPIVSVATTGFLVLFISSSTTIQFLILGQLQLDYALVFAAVSFAGGGLGNMSLNKLVKRYRKTWIIVAVLAVTILACTLLTAVTGYQRTVVDIQHGANMGLRPLCQ